MIVVYSSSPERVSRRDANKRTKNKKQKTNDEAHTDASDKAEGDPQECSDDSRIHAYDISSSFASVRAFSPSSRRVVALLRLSLVHDEFIEQWPQSLVQEVSECGNHHRRERRPIRRARRVLTGRRGSCARAPFKNTNPPSSSAPIVASAPSRLRRTRPRARPLRSVLTHLSMSSLRRRTRDRVGHGRQILRVDRQPVRAAAGRHTPTRDAATRAPSERANERANDVRVGGVHLASVRLDVDARTRERRR